MMPKSNVSIGARLRPKLAATALVLLCAAPAHAQDGAERGTVTAQIAASSYDAQALGARDQGEVRIVFALSPEGAISDCRVKQPSRSARLNAIACSYVLKRPPLNARLMQAMAAHGTPSEMIVSWKLFGSGPVAPDNDATTMWIGHALTDDDYPRGSLARREKGLVGFELAIDAAGLPTNCTVRESSGFAELDAATCRLMSERSNFLPAIDAQGRRQPSSRKGRIAWRLPR